MTKLQLRRIHRWLGLVAGIQLLLWTISGLYFTVIPIQTIRGNDYLVAPQPELKLPAMSVSPSVLLIMHPDIKKLSHSKLSLAMAGDRAVYLIADRRYDVETGLQVPHVEEAEAIAVVEQRTQKKVASIQLIEEVAQDHEYRGRDLPVWQAQLENLPDVNFYVDPKTARLSAVRTEAWRWFDFLWSLHIMDYEERDDFNHLLIQFMAVLGLITVLSGLILFFVTLRIRKP